MAYQTYLFYFVLFTSIFPLLALWVKGHQSIPLAVKLVLYFRFFTDVLCFVFTIYEGNSNPVFHFTLLINFYLIFNVMRQSYSFQKWNIPILLLSFAIFIWEMGNNSLFDSIILLNTLTYLLIAILGCFVIYRIHLNPYVNYVIFPLTAYYACLVFYALFQQEIDHSVRIYDKLFYVFAALTFLLNFTFTRTIWLKKLG
jgi:hypothetical protein